MPKHADVLTKYKQSYALCTLLRNADHLGVGHLAVNTSIKTHDLSACWGSGAVLYIVQHRTCFLHCFPALVIIMTSCWEAGRSARKDSLFTFAVPHLTEASPVGRQRERYKHTRYTDIGLSIYQGYYDISTVKKFEPTPVSIKNLISSHSSPSSDEVKNEWNSTQLNLCEYTVNILIKQEC
jgi:hypothetical protein